MLTMLDRFWRDDEGQDLIEYALLVAFVGLSCVAAWLLIQQTLGEGYTSMDLREQNDLAAETPDPW